MNSSPQVSVVIPTIRRPDIVVRACKTALCQTFSDLEVIVVIDGPDEATRASLTCIQDVRLRVVPLEQNHGLAAVRNIGVSHARGRWIAFLDDDDEWLEHKIEMQVKAAENLGGERIFMASEYLDKGPNFDRVLPWRLPGPEEPISEYLFCRRGATGKSGLVQPSTYFASATLLREVPFKAKLRPHEDFDWLLRAAKVADRPFMVVPGPLSIYHNEHTQDRESTSGNFDFYWRYVHENRDLFTPEAFSFYIAAFCTPAASASPDRLRLWWKVLQGIFEGRATMRCLVMVAGFALLSVERRRQMRQILSRLSGSPAPAGRMEGLRN